MGGVTVHLPVLRVERDHGAEAWTFSLTEFRSPDSGARIFLGKVADDETSVQLLAYAASLVIRASERPDLDSRIRYLSVDADTIPVIHQFMLLLNGGSYDPKVQGCVRRGV